MRRYAYEFDFVDGQVKTVISGLINQKREEADELLRIAKAQGRPKGFNTDRAALVLG